MRLIGLIVVTILIIGLTIKAWGVQGSPLIGQTPTVEKVQSSACDEFEESSIDWRACMRASEPCFAMHGRAYDECCETEKNSSACDGH
jgi:hypothetical protein